MSVPPTKFLVGGTDLNQIFAAYQGVPAPALDTGYKISTGQDLNQIFAPHQSGSQSILTGFKILTGQDLNTIFAQYENFTISGGSYTITSAPVTPTKTTYTIVINPGTTTLTFNNLPNESYCNFQLVGAGGGGGGTWSKLSDFTMYSGAGGGGGGNILQNDFTVTTADSYTITVGSGGFRGQSNNAGGDNSNTPGQPGGNTTLSSAGNTISATAFGGGGGESNTNSRSIGGIGGIVTATGSSGLISAGTGGNGGDGNVTGSYNSGTNGVNGYFYNNQGLSYPTSTIYPTYYNTNPIYVPPSMNLAYWYQVSGGGGGANSTGSNVYAAYQGGSGRGLGGSFGGYYSPTQTTPYPSFGGGGGGASLALVGFTGGNGLAVIWFSYINL